MSALTLPRTTLPGPKAPAFRDAVIGAHPGGAPAVLPGSAGNVLVEGESCSGKSYLAGLLVERWREHGERTLVVDVEGDHLGLGRFDDVTVLEGAHPTAQALRVLYRRRSVVVLDLSRHGVDAAREQLERLPSTVAWLRHYGRMPLRVLIDEAHQLVGHGGAMADGLKRTDTGYTFVTYRPDLVPWEQLPQLDAVLTVGGQDGEGHRRPALLTYHDEPPEPFTPGRRASAHVRHWHKYADGQLPAERCFNFTDSSGCGVGAAANMRDFVRLLEALPPQELGRHFARGDFSAWFAGMKNEDLAGRARELERAAAESEADAAGLRDRLAAHIMGRFGLGESPAPDMELSGGPGWALTGGGVAGHVTAEAAEGTTCAASAAASPH